MRLSNIAFISIIFFSVFGFVVFSYLIHELSHWQDFKEVAEDDRICFRIDNFSLDIRSDNADAAVYTFYPKEGSEKEVERIERYTEYKAYGIDAILLIIFSLAFSMVTFEWFGRKD